MLDHLGFKVIIISNWITPNLAQTVAETVKEKVDQTGKLLRQFEDFMFKYGKSYASTAEKLMRFEIFKDNLNVIDRLNAASDGTVQFGVNVFTDVTFAEYKASLTYWGGNRTRIEPEPSRVRRAQKMTGYKPPQARNHTEGGSENGNESGLLQASKGKGKSGPGIDLTEQPYPRTVDQGYVCGACYAFSIVGAIIVQVAKETKKFLDLSEQEIVDCTRSDSGNGGCAGGYFAPTFYFIQKTGLTTDSAYPYTEKDGTCKKNVKNTVYISNYAPLPKAQMQAELLAKRVFVTSMDASTEEFKNYVGGILRPKKCSPSNLDHAVAIVGFETVGSETIFIGRNSWGGGWGEKQGHFRMGGAFCGLGVDAWKFTLKK